MKGSRHSGGDQEACFQGFQKCTIFAQQTGSRSKSFRGKFPPPFFLLDGYGLTLNLYGNKRIGKIRTKTRISTLIPPFWQGNGTYPAPHSHSWPQTHYFYAEVLHLCIETIGWPKMCNSGKGHQFPLFGWGLAGLTFGHHFTHTPISRVGQKPRLTPYMTVYLVISLPKIPYIHRIYMVLANPTY